MGSIREEQKARKMNPHIHEWVTTSSITGPALCSCATCGEEREQVLSNPETWKTTKTKNDFYPGKPMSRWAGRGVPPRINDLYVNPIAGHVDTIGDHGGFADYHPGTREIELRDGTMVDFSMAVIANPELGPAVLDNMLRAEARKIALGGAVGAMDNLVKAVSGNSTGWTSNKALELIIEEIRHSDDPFVTGGEWIMKFTQAVTEVIRESDDEPE